MNSKLKRAWSGVAALGVAASTVLVFNVPSASAAGTLSGPATVRTSGGAAPLASGDSATTFTIGLPPSPTCPGDSANAGYRWQTYVVPASVDPSTLTFGSAGPQPTAVGAAYRQPLYTTTGSPLVNRQTANADTPGGPGLIFNIPDMDYAVFSPGDIPAGVYNIGIACTLGPAGPSQMLNYWNVQKTFSTAAPGAGGPAQVTWSVGAVPPPPVSVSSTPGDTNLTVAFSPGSPPANPAITQYTATATPATGSPVSVSRASSPIVIPGLTNGTAYTVTVKATNSAGDSAPSTALGPNVSTTPTAAPPAILIQRVTATRPAGALVFTQICGKNNAISASATFGTPAFAASLPAGESGPKTGDVGTPGASVTDPNYPANYPAGPATYPTYCGITMGPATLIRAGAGANQFLAATGVLNQVTVSDTRDTDLGWTVTGTMANLTGGPAGAQIAGNQLGWLPVLTPTPVSDDGAGNTYAQTLDPSVTANPGPTSGLGSARVLAKAAGGSGPATARTGGLGVAQLDAALKLNIPVSTPQGTYSGLLTLTLTGF